MSLFVVGLNHETAPLHIREKLSLVGDRLDATLNDSRRRFAEMALLSTCNRFEAYILAPGSETPRRVLASLTGDRAEEVLPYTYSYSEAAAAEHLFRVSSGIDSLVLGEVQILGQVRRAWQAAHQAGTAGPVLSQLFHRAVALGKRAHNETSISRRPASVSYAAVELARQVLGPDLHERRVLVIGSGEMGEGVAACLHDYGARATVVAHRQVERARHVARRYHADVASWDDLPRQLALTDIVISSTSAPHTILQRRHIDEAMCCRDGRPLYLIDLAVPRDIDPAAAGIDGVHLHNLDDLHAVVAAGMEERLTALPEIEDMIQEETRKFLAWRIERSAAPAIRDLQAQAESAVRAETGWALAKLSGLSDHERHVVEAMAARLAGKLMHRPIQLLKAQALQADELEYGIAPEDVPGLFYPEAAGPHLKEEI